jgi:phospholipase C
VESCKVHILDAYTKETVVSELEAGEKLVKDWSLEKFFGWYDLVVEVNSDSGFQQRIAGHVETGEDSMSDPAIGADVTV